MHHDYTADYLILGQGLAGTALAWTLKQMGCTVLVVDRDEPVTSSKVAAGLLTPITGMRFALADGYAHNLATAVRFYRALERRLGEKFLHVRGQVRLFKNDVEPARWASREGDPGVRRFIHPRSKALVDEAVFKNPRGGFQMKHSGFLDTVAYIEASRRAFEREREWMRADVDMTSVTPGPEIVEWNGMRFRAAIVCTGWEAAAHPLFRWVPFKPARGTILKVRADLHGERRIINHGCWMVARDDGLLRVGSTYDTKFTSATAVPEADLAALRQKLDAAIRVPYEIVEQASAVRPVIDKRLVLIGPHPAHSRLLFFNGLGSKGTLYSPNYAGLLARHLVHGEGIPTESDVRSNL